MQVIRSSLSSIDRRFIINQIPINIMLQNEPARIKPIIENLTAHHMSANSPAIFVFLFDQPIMSQHLDIEIEDLETRVVDVELGAFEEEKRVVIHPFRTPIEMHECCDILLCVRGIDQLGGLEVEGGCVEFEGLLVVRHAEPEMPKLMDWCRSLLESLGLVHWAMLVRGEVVGQLGEGLCDLE